MSTDCRMRNFIFSNWEQGFLHFPWKLQRDKRFSTRQGIQVRGHSSTRAFKYAIVELLETAAHHPLFWTGVIFGAPTTWIFKFFIRCVLKPVFPSCTCWQNWAEMGNAGSAIECCGPCTIDKSLVGFIFCYHGSCHFTFHSWRCVLQVRNLNRSALLAMILEHCKPRSRHFWVFIPACSSAFALWSSHAVVFWAPVH